MTGGSTQTRARTGQLPARPPAPAGLRLRVHRSPADLDALAVEWDGLLAAVPDALLSQSVAYTRAAWEAVAAPRGDRLAVVTVSHGDELLLVWPLAVESHRGFTVAVPLGNTSGQEYAGPLVRPGPHAQAASRLAAAVAHRLADVLALHHLPDRPLAPDGPLARFSTRTSTTSHLARRPADGSFDAWLAGRPQKLRWEIRRNRKRLDKAGALTVLSSDTDRDGGHGALDWIFARKREWLAERHLEREWINGDAAAAFFHALLDATAGAAGPRLLVIALRLDGRIVSASVCYRSAAALEGFMMAFDPSLAKLAPGNVLMEECVRAAFAAGCDFDFRIDPFDYKLRWADQERTHHTQVVPCTARGVPAVAVRHVQVGIGEVRRRGAPLLERYVQSAMRARAAHEPVSRVAAALVSDARTHLGRRGSEVTS